MEHNSDEGEGRPPVSDAGGGKRASLVSGNEIARVLYVDLVGDPVALGRPRLTIAGGKPVAYTPTKTRTYKSALQSEMRKEMEASEGRSLMTGPLIIEVAAYFAIPKSWPKWRQQAAGRGEWLHTSKPDGDNVLKMVLDAGTGVVFVDDAQAYDKRVFKGYGWVPRVEVTITEVAQWQRK